MTDKHTEEIGELPPDWIHGAKHSQLADTEQLDYPAGGYIEDGPHSMRADAGGSDTLDLGDDWEPIGIVSETTLNGIYLWIIESSPGGELRRQKVAFDEIPTVDETDD